MLPKLATLYRGEDVARGIAALLYTLGVYGETYHIASDRSVLWGDVLSLYKRVIADVTDREMRTVGVSSRELIDAGFAKQQILYDRMFDRRFDNSKITRLAPGLTFVPAVEGHEAALRAFLRDPRFVYIPAPAPADKLTGERDGYRYDDGLKAKARYFARRYLPLSLIKRVGGR